MIFISISLVAQFTLIKGIAYDESTVKSFLDKVPGKNLTENCSNAIKYKLPKYLSQKNILSAQVKHFYTSFGNGKLTDFMADRSVHFMMRCFDTADETVYSVSEYPFDYCYGIYESNEVYSICVPSVCRSDHEVIIEYWKNYTTKASTNMQLTSTECLRSRREKQWYQMKQSIIEQAINIIANLVVVTATVYQIIRGEDEESTFTQLFLAFSAKKSFQRLISTPKSSDSTITCLVGLRFLSMIWVLIGHSFAWVQAYIENIEDFKKDISDSLWNQWIVNSGLGVVNFLVMSATLTSYSWFTKQARDRRTNEFSTIKYWLRFYRHRLIRVWPAYLYTLSGLTFRISAQTYQSLWIKSDPYVQCSKHGWENILFINSLTNNDCLGWTWYISAEFIFYLLSPIFLLALRKSFFIGVTLCTSVLLACNMAVTLKIFRNNYPAVPLPWSMQTTYDNQFYSQVINLYIRPHAHIGSYLIGLLLGYLLSRYGREYQKSTNSRYYSSIFWTLLVILGLFVFFGLYPTTQGYHWPIYNALYGGNYRSLWALSIAWVIFACHNGFGGFINEFLSMRVFIPLSSLSYSAYLIHLVAIVMIFNGEQFPIVYTSKMQFAWYCSMQILITYLLAPLASFIAEFPALNMEKIIFYNEDRTSHELVQIEKIGLQKPIT